jgi:hypothetical protein
MIPRWPYALISLLFIFFQAASAGAIVCRKAQNLEKSIFYLRPEVREKFEQYRSDSVQGMEALRGNNGFPVDTVWVKNRTDGSRQVEKLNIATSPTNLAVDLLIQAELLENPQTRESAQARLQKTVLALSQVQIHEETGLFFSRYSAESADARVMDDCVSSIDNLHLAIALWTVARVGTDHKTSELAQKLFNRMDFSVYYNADKGLIGGNLREEKGLWFREAYDLANLGSEGRLLYSAGWAMGLFRNVKDDKAFLDKAIKNLKLEYSKTTEGKLMRLWDGSAFQLYFPRIFASEQIYSQRLKENFVNLGNFMINQGQQLNLPAPAAFNAIRVGTVEAQFQGTGSIYRDKSGNPELISSDNQDVHDPVLAANWDATVAPSAMLMAAAANPNRWAPILGKVESVQSGPDPLYVSGLGWMEGFHVKGPMQGQVVASQLSLNQGMITLSLFQATSDDGLGVSGRMLSRDPQISARMSEFYRRFDEKADATP